MRPPFFGPVVPPHVFSLEQEAVTYVMARRQPRPGVAAARRFPYPAGSFQASAFGPPVLAREAVAGAVAEAARLAGHSFSRASAVIPDSWTRVLTLDFEALPKEERESREIIAWRLRKLLAVRVEDLEIVFEEIPPAGEGRRLLVACLPREVVVSLEDAFAACGVRLGMIVPETVALFDGFDAALAAACRGDYLLLHRTGGSLALLVARGGRPLLWRQKGARVDEEAVAQEIRLSLTYYAKTFPGGTLTAAYFRDTVGGGRVFSDLGLAVAPQALRPELFSAEAPVGGDGDLMPAFAAAFGKD